MAECLSPQIPRSENSCTRGLDSISLPFRGGLRLIKIHLDIFVLSSYDGRSITTISEVVQIEFLAGITFTWQWSRRRSRYRFRIRAASVILSCIRRWRMTRKDSENETDRPHYYSQFWLDVAAGLTVIGASKVEEEEALAEDVIEIPEPTPLRRAGRNNAASITDGYQVTPTQTVAEPEFEPEEFAESKENELELESDVVDLELPDNVLDETEEVTIIPESVLIPDEEETEEEEELFYDEEEDEEDTDDWSARGRKKPKPGRQVKPPKSTKKPKRESRRSF
jgi:hypothetical protein